MNWGVFWLSIYVASCILWFFYCWDAYKTLTLNLAIWKSMLDKGLTEFPDKMREKVKDGETQKIGLQAFLFLTPFWPLIVLYAGVRAWQKMRKVSSH